MTTKANGLWKELGGTSEGWQAWLDSLNAPAGGPGGPSPMDRSKWSKLNRPIPEFSLSDQSGKSWTLLP
jgi:hypothetical protein